MTHYAKLAAIAFRLVAVVGLIYFLPSLLMIIRISRMGPMGRDMPMIAFAGVFIHPILAGLVFYFARPLGKFVAQGFDEE